MWLGLTPEEIIQLPQCPHCGLPMYKLEENFECVYCTWQHDQNIINESKINVMKRAVEEMIVTFDAIVKSDKLGWSHTEAIKGIRIGSNVLSGL
jgi:hypothetical protein